jgi:hypothetical protein
LAQRKQQPIYKNMKTTIASFLALCVAFSGCGTAKIAGRREISAPPVAKPAIIYVADFDLDVSSIKSERGILPLPLKAPGPLGDLLPPPPGAPKDPSVLAHELVDDLSSAIVRDLVKAGMNARRLNARSPIPSSGWLVRGVFANVNQGNQFQRAMIGFGTGKTDLQVIVDLNDLTQGAPQAFYSLNTTADSGKAPGAGPMIVLGAAGAAARFVLAGKDLNRNVKQTAARIAVEVIQRTERI